MAKADFRRPPLFGTLNLGAVIGMAQFTLAGSPFVALENGPAIGTDRADRYGRRRRTTRTQKTERRQHLHPVLRKDAGRFEIG